MVQNKIRALADKIPGQGDSNLIPCPHCNRKFNQQAADRHIPKCANITHKPKAPPTKEQVKNRIEERKYEYGSVQKPVHE